MDNHYTSDELLNVSNIGHFGCNTLSVLNYINYEVKKYIIRHIENEQYELLTEMNDSRLYHSSLEITEHFSMWHVPQ